MSSSDRIGGGEEVRLSEESIEAVAQRLAELLRSDGDDGESEDLERLGTLISALQISRVWGVSRRWVYDHAKELGVRQLGDGKRPRLRFDREAVVDRLGPPAGGDSRRSPRVRGDCNAGSLSSSTRASVRTRHRSRPGAAPLTPPRPGAEWAGATERLSPASPSCIQPARRRSEEGA